MFAAKFVDPLLKSMIVIAGLTLALGAGWPATAQESGEAAADDPQAVPSEEGLAEEGPADGAPAGESPAAPEGNAAVEGAAAAYGAKLQQWRDIIKDLQDLKGRFQTATPEEAGQIRKRWDELIVQGNALIPELQSAALDAYLAAPTLDRQLARLLFSFADDDFKNDRYESALQLADALIANDRPAPAYEIAGVSAFALNDYDKAKDYLQEAAAAGMLNNVRAKDYLPVADEYKRFWQDEQAIRKKEAEADDLPRVKLTTTKGDIVLELFENEAPGAVGNFISLVEKKFYDGLVFHRVLTNFMAQGGDPNGNGTGGPGYKIYCEVDKPNYRKHFQGSISMAHAGPNTGGSQFFLNFLPVPHLNGVHTVFGRVIEGMDVLVKLQRIDPEQEKGKRVEPDKIVTAEVIRKRPDSNYVPNKVK